MGKMNFGHNGTKQFKQIAKKIMEDHKDTFERLAEYEKQEKIEPVILEKEIHHYHNTIVEKLQDVHHHNTIEKINTIDSKARMHSIGLRTELHSLIDRKSQLHNISIDLLRKKLENLELNLSKQQKPQEKQILIETKEIKYELDKKLLFFNIGLIVLNLALLLFK